jgi:hypothetical protein
MVHVVTPEQAGAQGDCLSHWALNARLRGHDRGAKARRVIFINRYFFPDHSATGQILTDLAFHLAGLATDVRVVRSQQRFDGPRADLPETESIAG